MLTVLIVAAIIAATFAAIAFIAERNNRRDYERCHLTPNEREQLRGYRLARRSWRDFADCVDREDAHQAAERVRLAKVQADYNSECDQASPRKFTAPAGFDQSSRTRTARWSRPRIVDTAQA